MSNLIPIFSITVILGEYFTRTIIDEKLREILRKRGENPDIIEEEMRFGIYSPNQRIDMMLRDIEVRKKVDDRWGKFYHLTYIAGFTSAGVMLVWMLLGFLQDQNI
jgi:hypothetical protein